MVRVEIRPDAPLLGARAHLALRRAEQLGKVTGVMPPAATETANPEKELRASTAPSTGAMSNPVVKIANAGRRNCMMNS